MLSVQSVTPIWDGGGEGVVNRCNEIFIFVYGKNVVYYNNNNNNDDEWKRARFTSAPNSVDQNQQP